MAGTKGRKKKRRGFIMQPRDTAALWEIGIMRIADREQVKRAGGFTSTTRVNARLLALTLAGLLIRFFLGVGSARKALYALSAKGAALVHLPLRSPRRRADAMLVADFFVQHQLAVNEVYCTVKFGAIPIEGVRFLQWITSYDPIAPGVSLIPDGYVEFTTPSGIEAMFLEVDLGHESVGIWKEKAAKYLRVAASGEYAKRFRQPRFRVLVLANSPRRMHSLRAAIAGITEKIFWFATIDDAHGKHFFASVWLRPLGDTPQPLFEEPR